MKTLRNRTNYLPYSMVIEEAEDVREGWGLEWGRMDGRAGRNSINDGNDGGGGELRICWKPPLDLACMKCEGCKGL